MAIYQRKQLSTDTDVGPPGPLPDDLDGLADVSLADIEAAVGHDAAAQLGYLDTGFFPVVAGPVPGSVTNSQLRIALSDAALLDDANNAVATSPDPNDDIRWQYNSVFSETDAWLLTVFGSVGINHVTIFAAARAVPA
jgi:hypothetical protein